MHKHADVETRFPIPNGRNMRMTRSMSASNNGGPRLVQFEAEAGSTPSNLPFTPPGIVERIISNDHVTTHGTEGQDNDCFNQSFQVDNSDGKGIVGMLAIQGRRLYI